MPKFIDNTNTVYKKETKTVFTHYLDDVNGWVEKDVPTDNYETIEYLGYCKLKGDTFKAYKNGVVVILKGVKGTENYINETI